MNYSSPFGNLGENKNNGPPPLGNTGMMVMGGGDKDTDDPFADVDDMMTDSNYMNPSGGYLGGINSNQNAPVLSPPTGMGSYGYGGMATHAPMSTHQNPFGGTNINKMPGSAPMENNPIQTSNNNDLSKIPTTTALSSNSDLPRQTTTSSDPFGNMNEKNEVTVAEKKDENLMVDDNDNSRIPSPTVMGSNPMGESNFIKNSDPSPLATAISNPNGSSIDNSGIPKPTMMMNPNQLTSDNESSEIPSIATSSNAELPPPSAMSGDPFGGLSNESDIPAPTAMNPNQMASDDSFRIPSPTMNAGATTEAPSVTIPNPLGGMGDKPGVPNRMSMTMTKAATGSGGSLRIPSPTLASTDGNPSNPMMLDPNNPFGGRGISEDPGMYTANTTISSTMNTNGNLDDGLGGLSSPTPTGDNPFGQPSDQLGGNNFLGNEESTDNDTTRLPDGEKQNVDSLNIPPDSNNDDQNDTMTLDASTGIGTAATATDGFVQPDVSTDDEKGDFLAFAAGGDDDGDSTDRDDLLAFASENNNESEEDLMMQAALQASMAEVRGGSERPSEQDDFMGFFGGPTPGQNDASDPGNNHAAQQHGLGALGETTAFDGGNSLQALNAVGTQGDDVSRDIDLSAYQNAGIQDDDSSIPYANNIVLGQRDSIGGISSEDSFTFRNAYVQQLNPNSVRFNIPPNDAQGNYQQQHEQQQQNSTSVNDAEEGRGKDDKKAEMTGLISPPTKTVADYSEHTYGDIAYTSDDESSKPINKNKTKGKRGVPNKKETNGPPKPPPINPNDPAAWSAIARQAHAPIHDTPINLHLDVNSEDSYITNSSKKPRGGICCGPYVHAHKCCLTFALVMALGMIAGEVYLLYWLREVYVPPDGLEDDGDGSNSNNSTSPTTVPTISFAPSSSMPILSSVPSLKPSLSIKATDSPTTSVTTESSEKITDPPTTPKIIPYPSSPPSSSDSLLIAKFEQDDDAPALSADDISVSLSSNGKAVSFGSPSNNDFRGKVFLYHNLRSFSSSYPLSQDGQNAGDRMGSSIAMSRDGSVVVVGSPYYNNEAGLVRVYVFGSGGSGLRGEWTRLGNDIIGTSMGDREGSSVSISGDGERFATGAPFAVREGIDSGRARIYRLDGSMWDLTASIDGDESGDKAGFSVSLSSNGNFLAVGAPYADNGTGYAKVFQRYTTSWGEVGGKITGYSDGNLFGSSVSLSDTGILAVGAKGHAVLGMEMIGFCKMYRFIQGTGWTGYGRTIEGASNFAQLGYKVSLSGDGSHVVIASRAPNFNGMGSGSVGVYKMTVAGDNGGTDWTQLGEDLKGESLDDFGFSVAISYDGSTVGVGARKMGKMKAYVYNYSSL